MNDKKPEPKLVEVTLAKAHTHAGVDYVSGNKIKVDEAERAWLAAHKIINDAPTREEGAK